MLNRRGLIGSLLTAPAIVSSLNLMALPKRKLIVNNRPIINLLPPSLSSPTKVYLDYLNFVKTNIYPDRGDVYYEGYSDTMKFYDGVEWIPFSSSI